MVMKILDWMHRKLHPVNDYCRVPHGRPSAFEQDAGELSAALHKSLGVAEFEHNTEASLLHHMLEGILTIGTLGHPHPNIFPNRFPDDEEEEPKLESSEKELTAVEKPSGRITRLQPEIEMLGINTEQIVENVGLAEERMMAEVPLLKEDSEPKLKGRTTLADLLASEPAPFVHEPLAVTGVAKNPITVLTFPGESSSAWKGRGKEKMKLKKENNGESVEDSSLSSYATKRIRRMITKMVKKKIHPEAAAAHGSKGEGVPAAGVDPLLLSNVGGGDGGDEAGHLFQV